MKRYLQDYIAADLGQKMVFVGGPRQVGKTTLALELLQSEDGNTPFYFNWDSRGDRLRLRNEKLPAEPGLIVLDEIHKFRGWRNLVKGLYDKQKTRHQFLVTGSARLDIYRRGGDSLQGRYHYFHLHPLSVGELAVNGRQVDLPRLLEFGGFPEPYLAANKRHWRRWQNERLSRIVKDDVVSLEQVGDLGALELLMEILPTKVGSPLSIQNLATDLEVAHKTAKRWVGILERLYHCFQISPVGLPKVRAVKKEQKLYLWDWSLCIDEAARFENLVACQLLKYCHFMQDTEGFNLELRYLRDSNRREVDFVVLRDRSPIFAVECKLSPTDDLKQLHYFRERTNIPSYYLVHSGSEEFSTNGITVLPLLNFARKLGLP